MTNSYIEMVIGYLFNIFRRTEIENERESSLPKVLNLHLQQAQALSAYLCIS